MQDRACSDARPFSLRKGRAYGDAGAMRYALALCLCLLAPAAGAQSALQTLPGLYGSASDPAQSCTANPHHLEVTASPPHLMLTWGKSAPDPRGGRTGHLVYDLLAADAATLTLRLEGETRAASNGGPVIWTLRQTEDGYCWARPDWPVMRCEERQLRCDAAAPTS